MLAVSETWIGVETPHSDDPAQGFVLAFTAGFQKTLAAEWKIFNSSGYTCQNPKLYKKYLLFRPGKSAVRKLSYLARSPDQSRHPSSSKKMTSNSAIVIMIILIIEGEKGDSAKTLLVYPFFGI